MFLLRSRRPQRYGKWIERMLAPEPKEDEENCYEDPGITLDGELDCMECDAKDVPPADEEDGLNDDPPEQP